VSATLAVMEDTALATVVQETCITLGHPDEMTDDQLADAVIQAFSKIRDYLPYIIALKSRFNDGDRDSENHLLTPIKGCYSWKEFCKFILNRAPETVREAIAAAKKPKAEAHAVTEAEFAEYEQENQGIRKLTKKLLADGLPEADVISALVNMEHPKPMAEAAVRMVTLSLNPHPLPSTEIASLREWLKIECLNLDSVVQPHVKYGGKSKNVDFEMRDITIEEVQVASRAIQAHRKKVA
jgi:hypothetical protein